MKITNWSQAMMKAIEWRVIAWGIDFVIALILTHEVTASIGIASLSSVVKFVTNFIWIRKRFS